VAGGVCGSVFKCRRTIQAPPFFCKRKLMDEFDELINGDKGMDEPKKPAKKKADKAKPAKE